MPSRRTKRRRRCKSKPDEAEINDERKDSSDEAEIKGDSKKSVEAEIKGEIKKSDEAEIKDKCKKFVKNVKKLIKLIAF